MIIILPFSADLCKQQNLNDIILATRTVSLCTSEVASTILVIVTITLADLTLAIRQRVCNKFDGLRLEPW